MAVREALVTLTAISGDTVATMIKTMMLGAIMWTAACGTDEVETSTASATFTGTNGQTVAGTAKFTLSGSAVTMTATFTAGPAGVHGVHIHNVPMCGNEGMDAGPHWDDADTSATGHGLPGAGHLGDTGNVTIDAAGAGTFSYSNPEWTLGDGGLKDVLNRGMIFHEKMDDGTMPSAGLRWGCGTIAMD